MLFEPSHLIQAQVKTSKETLQKSFGLHVNRLRTDKGLTQVEVSGSMDKDQQSLQRIESGNVSPSLYYLWQLAQALDISLAKLVTFDLLDSKKKRH